MNEFLVFVSILLIILTGMGLLRILNISNMTFVEKLGISYGIGCGVIFLLMFCYSIISIPWTRLTLLLPLSVFILLTFQKINFLKFKIKPLKLNIIESVLLVMIIIISMFVILGSLLRPVPAWDGWAAFFMQGRGFYIDGFLNPDIARYGGISNPPLVASLIAYIYTIVGSEADRLSLLFYSTFYISTLITVFAGLQRNQKKVTALFFTLILASVPNLIRHSGYVDVGHADIIVGYFILSAAITFLGWLRTGNIKYAVLFQIVLGIGALVKGEGLAFYLVGNILFVISILRIKNYILLYSLLVGLIFVLPWEIFKNINSLPENPFYRNAPEFSRVFRIFVHAVSEFADFRRWGVIWVGGLLLLLLNKISLSVKFLLIMLLLQISIYLIIYLTTSIDPVQHMKGSFDRLLLHILPLFVFCIGLAFSYKKKLYAKKI